MIASDTRPTSRQARPKSCWIVELNGSSSAASRNGTIASAGRPALSNWVANASRGAICCGAAGLGDWDMRRSTMGDAPGLGHKSFGKGVDQDECGAKLRCYAEERN